MEYRTKILWADQTRLPLDWGVKRHTHGYYQMIYTIQGKSEFIVDGVHYVQMAGDCLLVPPHCAHETVENQYEESSFYETKFLILDPYISSNLKIVNPSVKGNEFIRAGLAYIADHWISRNPQKLSNIDSFLSAILIYFLNTDAESRRENSRYIDTSPFGDITKQIILYVEQNYDRPFKLDELSGKLGYNRNYLCSVFKKDTGFTIVNYINFIRIRRATELFSYTGGDVIATSARLGFAYVSHFSRTFKALVGVTPSKYRRVMQIDLNGNLGKDILSDSIFNDQVPTIDAAIANLKLLGQVVRKRDKERGVDD